jgi:methylated-DNA-[protein]-cysteine S-methyltransferase
MDHQTIIVAPFGKLGIHCSADALLGIEFLPVNTRTSAPHNPFAKEVCLQLETYFIDADFHFDLPLKLDGTPHQRTVWQAMCAIPRGHTLSYGELSTLIGSSPRAVGQACGNNPIPVIVPCHRVVSKAGLGGFMHRADSDALDIKRWLLMHEQR